MSGNGGVAAGRRRSTTLQRLRGRLRAPRTIIGELIAIALAAILGTVVPQRGLQTERWLRWRAEWPAAAEWSSRLGLDRVYDSGWFLALVLLAGASLWIVIAEQWRRLRRDWSALPPELVIAAPYRLEFERPARGVAGAVVRVRGRVGQLGSPLLHLGLGVVVLAGLIRLLFAATAQADVCVGETLGTRVDDWGQQWPGRLGAPVVLPTAATFADYRIEAYGAGGARMLSADLRTGPSPGGTLRASINAPARVGPVSIYVDSRHGPTALLIVRQDGRERRYAVMLRDEPDGPTGSEWLDDGTELRLRGEPTTSAAELPRRVELRALRRAALLGVGLLGVGEQVSLPGGATIELVAMRWWARFTGTRDPSVPFAFAGIAMAVVGATLLFTFVRRDAVVRVTPGAAAGDEHVSVALRPRRFAPIFRREFAALVRAEGGPPIPW